MRLRMLVGRLGFHQLVGEGIDVEMALARAVDAIGPVQAGVEPLRAVGSDALGGEHIGKLVAEGERRFFGCEVIALPAPIGPGTGQAIENLARVGFGTVLLVLRQILHGGKVSLGAPQPGGNGVFPRPSSGAQAHRPCGNISAPGYRLRLG